MMEKPRVQPTVSVPGENELISRAQTGDRDAFCDLVRYYRSSVFNVVYRMCGNADLADDAAQQTFLSAWRCISGFKARTNFRNWLYRIAVNAALDMLRKERPTVSIELLPIAAPGMDPQATTEERERANKVRCAVLALPEASRVVLVLREYENLTYEEIAEALEIPLGTVMSRLSYARKLLAERLKHEMEIG